MTPLQALAVVLFLQALPFQHAVAEAKEHKPSPGMPGSGAGATSATSAGSEEGTAVPTTSPASAATTSTTEPCTHKFIGEPPRRLECNPVGMNISLVCRVQWIASASAASDGPRPTIPGPTVEIDWYHLQLGSGGAAELERVFQDDGARYKITESNPETEESGGRTLNSQLDIVSVSEEEGDFGYYWCSVNLTANDELQRPSQSLLLRPPCPSISGAATPPPCSNDLLSVNTQRCASSSQEDELSSALEALPSPVVCPVETLLPLPSDASSLYLAAPSSVLVLQSSSPVSTSTSASPDPTGSSAAGLQGLSTWVYVVVGVVAVLVCVILAFSLATCCIVRHMRKIKTASTGVLATNHKPPTVNNANGRPVSSDQVPLQRYGEAESEFEGNSILSPLSITTTALGNLSPTSTSTALGNLSPTSTSTALGNLSPASTSTALGNLSPTSTSTALGNLSPASTGAHATSAPESHPELGTKCNNNNSGVTASAVDGLHVCAGPAHSSPSSTTPYEHERHVASLDCHTALESNSKTATLGTGHKYEVISLENVSTEGTTAALVEGQGGHETSLLDSHTHFGKEKPIDDHKYEVVSLEESSSSNAAEKPCESDPVHIDAQHRYDQVTWSVEISDKEDYHRLKRPVSVSDPPVQLCAATVESSDITEDYHHLDRSVSGSPQLKHSYATLESPLEQSIPTQKRSYATVENVEDYHHLKWPAESKSVHSYATLENPLEQNSPVQKHSYATLENPLEQNSPVQKHSYAIVENPLEQNSPVQKHSYATLENPLEQNSPVQKHSYATLENPLEQNSPVQKHSYAIVENPLEQNSPVQKHSYAIVENPLEQNSPVQKHSYATLENPLEQNSPVQKHSYATLENPLEQNSPVQKHSYAIVENPLEQNSPVQKHSYATLENPLEQNSPVQKHSYATLENPLEQNSPVQKHSYAIVESSDMKDYRYHHLKWPAGSESVSVSQDKVQKQKRSYATQSDPTYSILMSPTNQEGQTPSYEALYCPPPAKKHSAQSSRAQVWYTPINTEEKDRQNLYTMPIQSDSEGYRSEVGHFYHVLQNSSKTTDS